MLLASFSYRGFLIITPCSLRKFHKTRDETLKNVTENNVIFPIKIIAYLKAPFKELLKYTSELIQ